MGLSKQNMARTIGVILAFSLALMGCRNETAQPPETNQLETQIWNVTFRDHDGRILKTQTVEPGKSAQAPEEPTREGFQFAGWDRSFDCVTSHLTVTATYNTNKIVISAQSVTVPKGTDQVTVNVQVLNNPGILGAVIRLSVDDEIFAFQEGISKDYPGMTLTSPGPSSASSPYTFMLDAIELSEEERIDGTLFAVTFRIKDSAASGTYQVTVSCDQGGIFDEFYADLDIVLENGTITIEEETK